MSSKRSEEDDDDFSVGDDDDDEDDFIPGAEEEEEEEEQEDSLLRGKITLDDSGNIVLKGEGFHLQSTEKFQIGKEFLLVGPWQLTNADPKLKAPPRRIRVTLSATKGKRDETSEESYELHGREEGDGDCIELSGSVTIGKDFCCRYRQIQKSAAVPMAAAAAASVSKDDDDDEDADDDVDFDELAALHEDARLSVDAVLQKRYRADDSKESGSNKRGKTETDDDEDIEF